MVNKIIKWHNNRQPFDKGEEYLLKAFIPVRRNLKSKTVSVLIFADLHGSMQTANQILDEINDKHFDFAVSLGDMSIDVLNIINNFLINKGKKLYAIRGNHDTYSLSDISENIIDFNRRVVDINGVKIYGVEGARYYNDYSTFVNDEEIFNEKIPEDIDLLFSHTKAYTETDKDMWPIRKGLIGLNKIICNTLVKHHFYGHFHNEVFQDVVHGIESKCVYEGKIIKLKI